MVDPRDEPNSSIFEKMSKKALRGINETLKIAKTRMAVGCRYVIDKPSKGTTVLRIKDLTKGKYGQWVVRVDKMKPNAKFPSHVNINPRYTGVPDPHTPISSTAVVASEKIADGAVKIQNYMTKANKVLLPLAIALDTARIGMAFNQDVKNAIPKPKKPWHIVEYKNNSVEINLEWTENKLTMKEKLLNGLKRPKETIKAASSVAAGWGGGAAGAYAGGQGGMWIGGVIGGAFGGVGAAPGAAIGAIAGSVLGAIGLGIGGSIAGQKIGGVINDRIFDDKEDEEVLETLEIPFFLSMPNLYFPKNEDETIETKIRSRAMTI